MATEKAPQRTFEDYKYFALHYISLVWRWKFFVIPIFALSTIAVFSVLVEILSLTPVKSTSVLVGIDNPNKMSAVADVGDLGMNKYELIKSRKFLETIIEEFSLQFRLKKYPRKRIFQKVAVDSSVKNGSYKVIVDKNAAAYTILLTNKKKGYYKYLVDEGALSALNSCRIQGVNILFNEEYLKEPYSIQFGVVDKRIAVDKLLENLRVSDVQGTNFLITLNGTDYELITKTVNRIADAFVESTLNFRKRRTQKIFDVLQKQLDQSRQELDISKEALRSFMSANPTVRIGNGDERTSANTTMSSDLINMETRSVSNVSALKMADNLLQRYNSSSPEARFQTVREILAYITSQQHPSAAVLTADLTRQLDQKEGVESKYAPEHPTRIKFFDDLESTEKRILQALNETTQSISTSNDRQKKGIDALNEQLKTIPTKELRLAELDRKYRIDNQLYSDILSQYNAAKISNAAEMADVYVMDYAVEPLYTSQLIKLIQILFGAMVVGLFVSIVPLIIKNSIDDHARTTEDLKRKTKAPVLSTIPVIVLPSEKEKKENPGGDPRAGAFQMLASAPHYISEIFRSLRTGVLLAMSATESKVIAVTSYSSGDGKSMLATNLAVMCARNGLKTVLVDLDLRCGVLDRTFGLPESPGFSDIFLDKNSEKQLGRLMDAMRKTEIPDLSILTSGPKPPNPQELLGSRFTPYIIAGLRKHFDLVVIDCAPIGLTSDPAVISESVDKYIVVVRACSTKIGRLKSKIGESPLVQSKLMGYILNRAVEDVVVKGYKRSNYYNYGYGAAATDPSSKKT